jgi:hypothetical protein
LIIDPDRILPPTIRTKWFEAIAGRHAKIAERPSLIPKTKLSQSDILDIRRQFSAPASGPDQFRLGIGKALDHERL